MLRRRRVGRLDGEGEGWHDVGMRTDGLEGGHMALCMGEAQGRWLRFSLDTGAGLTQLEVSDAGIAHGGLGA